MAGDKHIILAQGDSWHPLLAENLIKNHHYIETLPFSGFVMVGNSFTNDTMKKDETLTYDYVWKELHGLKGLYKKKTENFLMVNIGFPADFWDDKAWKRVAKNFGIVARAAKNLGFRGIAIDDEGYGSKNRKMLNFKFPKEDDVAENPQNYTYWEREGSQPSWVDYHSYRNPKYTFKEHTDKVTQRFNAIMQEMQREENFPNLSVLVYYGPSFSHENRNKEHLIITDLGRANSQELKGAIFLGLKRALKGDSSLHDMGENYKYRKDVHFENSYILRKYKIATAKYNDELNPKYQWKIPKQDQPSWSSKVNVGFMTSNLTHTSYYPEYYTKGKSDKPSDIQYALKKALKYSDKYVIYYCQKQNWLEVDGENSVTEEWYDMMQELAK
jgi:adenylate kinase family enzyme